MCGWNAARDTLSGPHVTTVFQGTRVTSIVVAIGAVHQNIRYNKGGGFLCKKSLGRGTGRGFLYTKGGGFLCRKGSRKGSRKGVPVHEGGFLWGSWDGS